MNEIKIAWEKTKIIAAATVNKVSSSKTQILSHTAHRTHSIFTFQFYFTIQDTSSRLLERESNRLFSLFKYVVDSV